jgi:hypothetical protein
MVHKKEDLVTMEAATRVIQFQAKEHLDLIAITKARKSQGL